jgi:hypothetical protein
VLLGRVTLPAGAWRRLEVAVPAAGRGVLRLHVVPPFRPASRRDPRLLGIEVGSGPEALPGRP